MRWLNSFWIHHSEVRSRRDLSPRRPTRQEWPNCDGNTLEGLRTRQKLTGIPQRRSFDLHRRDFPLLRSGGVSTRNVELTNWIHSMQAASRIVKILEGFENPTSYAMARCWFTSGKLGLFT